ncbi:MAG: ribosomal-processing cysteine protease Prp [Ruminococcus sp.]|nr:ribosomal-processing cysteine protease Prp [Ruminococcus sp.]
MIKARFFQSGGFLTGFEVSGHAGFAESGKDIVCAAVSSAVQLTVNLLDELGFTPDVNVGDDVIRCIFQGEDIPSRMAEQLRLHFESILEEFPGTIKITISEV